MAAGTTLGTDDSGAFQLRAQPKRPAQAEVQGEQTGSRSRVNAIGCPGSGTVLKVPQGVTKT